MRSLSIAVLAFVAAACSDSTSPAGPVVAAEILPADTAITSPTTLTGQGIDDMGRVNNGATVTWASLTPGIVAVDQTGLVTPVGTGIGRVQITVEAFTAEATVRAVGTTTTAADLLPLYPFSAGPVALQAFSDVSQADADARAAAIQNPRVHFASVFQVSPPNTATFFTSWRNLWAAAIPLCGGVDDPTRAAHSFCGSPPRHFMMAVDDNHQTAIRFLGQQFMQANYGAADDFPWLQEGWSSWLAGGAFDETGQVSVAGPRQVIIDDFAAADAAGLLPLSTVLQMPAATFYSGTPPLAQIVAQATMFWGWLVSVQPDAAARVFNEIRLNPSISNGDLLGDMFNELGMEVEDVDTMYVAWARAR
ncbi:MAG: hypothetical protein OEO23_06080 [Gemmatimonadota bacterium]|nr:hypothetical protein [Gemmatimonadota bacterium]